MHDIKNDESHKGLLLILELLAHACDNLIIGWWNPSQDGIVPVSKRQVDEAHEAG